MKDYPLLTVCIVASLGIVSVMILGSGYDKAMAYYHPKPKNVSYVDCSVDIVNMAKRINVTLIGRCVKDET